MRVAVAGGTGLVGRHGVRLLQAAGHEPVVLARSGGVDLTTGAGLAAALTGVNAVVDVSNINSTRRRTATAFFTAGTGALLTAGARAGVGHQVVLSIVGCDLVPLGYYRAKLAQEELALAGPVPVTVLRATQFHEFAGQLLARVPGPVAVLPRMRIQPVAAREVAQALVEIAVEPAVGRAADLAGPADHELVDLARQLLQAQGSRRRVLPVRLPGPGGRALAGSALLPADTARRGSQTFAEWLNARRSSAESSVPSRNSTESLP